MSPKNPTSIVNGAASIMPTTYVQTAKINPLVLQEIVPLNLPREVRRRFLPIPGANKIDSSTLSANKIDSLLFIESNDAFPDFPR